MSIKDSVKRFIKRRVIGKNKHPVVEQGVTRRLDKVRAGLAGAGVLGAGTAAAAMASDSDEDAKLSRGEKIKKKVKDGKQLTSAEKKYLRLMEED